MQSIIASRFLVALFVTGSLVYFFLLLPSEIGHTLFDDAYMYIRYSQNWLHGHGFSWNAEDGPVYGITSTAYLFLITALLSFMHVSDGMLLTGTSCVAGLLSCAAMVYLGFLTMQNQLSRTYWLPLLIVPIFLSQSPFKFHCYTGMETTFSVLLNTLLACGVVITSRKPNQLNLLLCGLIAYLCYLTRPDVGIYALLFPPLFLLATDRSLWKYALSYSLGFVLVLAVDCGLKLVLFNDVLPLPFYAKSTGFYKGYLGVWNQMEQMLFFLVTVIPFVLIIINNIVAKHVRQIAAILIPLLITVAYLATVTQIMGHNFRYYVPSIPFIVLASFIVLSTPDSTEQKTDASQVVFYRLLVSFLCLSILISDPIKHKLINLWGHVAIKPQVAYQPKSHYALPVTASLPELNWWNAITTVSDLLKRMPKGIVFAASEHGYISAQVPDITIIDLVGLHDRTIAKQGFSASYILSRQPDIIMLPVKDYSYDLAELLDNQTLKANYEYYPGVFDYGIAIAKTSKYFPEIKAVLAADFMQTYSGLKLDDYLATWTN
ncbi:hypothetical protein [Methylomonas sp. AM2-LC]|uniref:hypothetical protein n=1 Tax=Methylomonas sp. AM2-LC TaxID=3153301 RepID=UPI003263F9C7